MGFEYKLITNGSNNNSKSKGMMYEDVNDIIDQFTSLS